MPAVKTNSPLSLWEPSGMPAESSDTAVCNCGNSWFELVFVQQYVKNHLVILGQKPPKKTDVGFYLLRCPRCSSLYEPTVQTGSYDKVHKDYQSFVDLMLEPVKEKVTTRIESEDV